MLFSMARRGEAPTGLARVNEASVPARAVAVSAAAGFVSVLGNYFLPTDAVFTFLLNSSGAAAVVVYLCVAATHIAGRRLGRTGRTGRTGSCRPLWSWCS